MRTPDRSFALAYFENRARHTLFAHFSPGAHYRWTWYDPQTGAWLAPIVLRADPNGTIATPTFPMGGTLATQDYAAKIMLAQR